MFITRLNAVILSQLVVLAVALWLPVSASAQNSVYRYNGKTFVKLNGVVTDIGVGANGAAWVVGNDGAAWRRNGNTWKRVGGAKLGRIAVGPKGNAWAVSSDKQELAKPKPKRVTALSWKKMPGGAVDISVAPNGAVWLAGTDGAAYRWNGRGWVKAGGRAVTRVAADPKDGAWLIANKTQIWRYSGGSWKKLPGVATDIGVGANGTAWVVGNDGAGWRRSGTTWKRVGGRDFVRIAVDPKGNAWAIDKKNVIFRYLNKKFQQMPGRAKDIGIGANGVIWIAGTNGGPWRWDGKTWQPYVGRSAVIAVDPKGFPWAIKAKGQIFADSRSRSVKSPPKPVAPGMSPQNRSSMLNGAGTLIKALKIPHLSTNWNRWSRSFRLEGAYLKLNVRVLNQPATIIIYRPKGRPRLLDKPNVAVLTGNFKISNFIKSTADTIADDLRVNNVTYIFVPPSNAQDINTRDLPGQIKQQVQSVRTGPISLIQGNNMFGVVNSSDNGTTAKFLKKIGVPLGNLKVHAAYGIKKSKVTNRTSNYQAVRLTRAGRWNEPFKLKNTSLNNPTLAYAKLDGIKTFHAWGMGRLQQKNYFMYLRKRGGKGPFPTAAAFDARSVTLKDYKDAALVMADTVYGGIGQVQTLLKGIDRLPLDQVSIVNPRHVKGGAIDKDNNPVFKNLLIKAAGPTDVLPGEKRTGINNGPAMRAQGNGKVFGHTAVKMKAWIKKSNRAGMDVKATVRLPSPRGMTLGNFDLNLYKNNSTYDMAFTGRSKVTFKGKTVINEKVTMKFDNNRLVYNVGASCPLRFVGFDVSINYRKFTDSRITPKGKNPFGCLGGAVGLIIAGAEAAAKGAAAVGNVAAYSASEIAKKTDPVSDAAKAAYDGAMKGYRAAMDTWNDLSNFLQGQKSRPSRPSSPPRIRCKYPQIVWEGRCQTNLAANFGAGAYAGGSSEFSSKNKMGNLVDGDLNGVASTKFEANPWMDLGLGRKRVWVDRIVIFNRPDNYAHQLKGAIVAVSAKYSGKELMTKQDPEIYRIRLNNPGRANVIRPGKWGEGKWAKHVMVYHLPTAKKPSSVMALSEFMVFSNDCKCPSYWRQVPARAVDIAASPGKIWHIGTDGHLYSSAVSLKNMPTAKRPWKKITPDPDPNGVMHRVTVDPWGNPWVVLTGGQIYRYNKGKWFWVPGNARDIAAAGKNMTMASGYKGMEVFAKSYGAPDAIKSWKFTGGNGTSIAAAFNNISWLVKISGEIWQRPAGKNWKKIPGRATDIATNGTTTFHIGSSGVPYKYVPRSKSWLRMHGWGNKRIAVDATGRPWMVDANSKIWAWHDYKKK